MTLEDLANFTVEVLRKIPSVDQELVTAFHDLHLSGNTQTETPETPVSSAIDVADKGGK